MRLHPLSVPYRATARGLSLGTTLFFLGLTLAGTEALPIPLTRPVLIAAGVAGFLLAALWQVAYYRRFDYELSDDGLEIASGVVSRRHREIPLGRVQNVDISRNVVQRALGLAALDLETAGGGGTEASLRYVSYEEAKRLQREIQRRKRGAADRTVDAEGVGERDTDAEGERPADGSLADEGIAERGEELFALSAGELALVSVLSFDLRYFSLLAFGPALFPFVPGVTELAVFGGVVLAALLGVGLWALSAAVTFARYYDFRLARVGDELRYERGLLERYDGSIPLAKVQTLSMGENILMRRFGYATLAVETAGYGPGQSPSQGSEAAIPLAARERVIALAREIEPFEPTEFSRPPKRARTRYAFRYVGGLALLVAVLYAVWSLAGRPFAWYAPFAPLAFVVVAPLTAHLKWANRGYATGATHVFTRNGFWNRTTKIVPYYRVQNVIETQTIFQRRRRLASVLVDTASSAGIGGRVAAAVDLDDEDAAELRELVGERLQASLSARRADDGKSAT